MTTLVTGAFGCIGAWVIRGLLAPPASVRLRSTSATTRAGADDRGARRDRPCRAPAPATSLDAGIRQTLDEFARLQKDERLDSRALT